MILLFANVEKKKLFRTHFFQYWFHKGDNLASDLFCLFQAVELVEACQLSANDGSNILPQLAVVVAQAILGSWLKRSVCFCHGAKTRIFQTNYRATSNIRRTKSQNLNIYHLVLSCPCLNLLKPWVKSRMKMQLEQRRQVMHQLHMNDQQFHCLLRCV